jgi:outer membrane protein OmpA-like peptidoglycan-associated protein
MKRSFVSSLFSLGLVSTLFLTVPGSLNRAVAQGVSDDKSTVNVIGHQLDNTVIKTILSAKVGGTMGTMINKNMDLQAAALKANLPEAKVMRFEEGILVTIDSRLVFEEDSHGIAGKKMLKDLARVLEKYSFTEAVIEVHSDNVGEEIYSQSLSESRAHEIENYLVAKGIKDDRMKSKGYGEAQPIASNDTEAGRRSNRRIEIAIYASDELRRATSPEDALYTALKQ